jgi:hypothetical protein
MRNNKRNKSPLKLIFGIVGVLIVLAFSMALTTTTTFAQQAATATPTATVEPTQAPASTPAPGATQAPGTTGVIPVTGANQALNNARALAFSKAVTRFSNVTNNNLEDSYSELLARLQKEERMLNSATNKLNHFTDQLGKNAFNNNAQNQNGLNASDTRNRHLQAIQRDFLTLTRNVTVARQQVLLAQIALNSSAGFDADGNLTNRQAAINALALAQISLDRGMAALRQVTDIAEAR